MRWLSLGSLATLVIAALPLASASAQEQLSINCSVPPQNYVGGNYAGQLIIPRLAVGLLTRAEIAVRKDPGTNEDYVIEIRAAPRALPTSTVLASTTIPSASVPAGDSFISASFPNPVKFLTTRVLYMLVVHRAGDLLVGAHNENFCGPLLWFGDDPSGSDWLVGDWPEAAYNVYVTPFTCMGKQATIVGTPRRDVRRGTAGKDVIVALGGNDTLSGLAGNDLICGGAGNDTLSGGDGKDALLGQKGNDALNGGKGKDALLGHRGRDKLRGGPGKDRLKGGAGRDEQLQRA